jgi:hypothetical protein
MTSVRPLRELVEVIRSKNAGPFRLTLDILFKDFPTYQAVKVSKAITPALIARLYHVRDDQITDFVEFDPGKAIKATLVRPVSSGAPGDTDIYGAQQHAPLLTIAIPLPDQ